MQQNLNHWNSTWPGFLDLAVSYVLTPSDGDFTVLATWPDFPANEMVWRTSFAVPVTFPKASAHAILRVRYVSFNRDESVPNNANSTFFNCADIRVLEAAGGLEAAPPPAEAAPSAAPAAASVDPAAGESPFSCAAPPTFSMNVSESNQWGLVYHRVWWDAPTNMTRWDRVGQLDATPGSSSLSVINNYSAPIEYVIFETGKCEQYGSDFWYEWSYGRPGSSMQYAGRVSSDADRWVLPGTTQYAWLTRNLGGGLCAPLSWTAGEASFTVTAFDTHKIDASLFVPPAACATARFAGCHAQRTKGDRSD